MRLSVTSSSKCSSCTIVVDRDIRNKVQKWGDSSSGVEMLNIQLVAQGRRRRIGTRDRDTTVQRRGLDPKNFGER